NAPCIRQVVHEPSAPAVGEPVIVSARVSDPEGVAWVVLKYQRVLPGSYVPATLPNYPQTQPATIANPAYDATASWVSMTMNDLGTDGDNVAGDGVYSVTVPGTLQQHRHLLRYRIAAGDNSNKSITVPYDDDSQRNFAWFTYNGIPGWSGAIDPYSSDSAYKTKRTFSAELMNSVPAIHLLSRNADVMACQYNSSYDNTSYYFSGTIIYNGRVYDNIHYHVRGQASTFVWGKNKWKFKFNPARDFINCDIYGNEYKNGADTLNLGSGVCAWWKYPHPNGPWDKGAGGMVLNEMLAYRYYQLAGAAASNTAFAQLRIIDNAIETSSTSQFDGDFWGLYITVEHADGSFLDERQMADGNIFRMDGGYNQTHQCATQPDDGSDINSLRYVLNNTKPSEQWWQSNFNLEHYYSTRAVGIAINDADRRVDANCIFYHDSETDLWWYIPWDLDLAFEPGGHYSPSSWENVQKALAYSQYKMEYQNRGRELIDLLFNGEQAAQLVDEIAALIYTPGALSFVDAERARWDNCSFVASAYRKLWYKHNEFLASEDFAGMIAYMKRAVSPAGFTAAGSAYNSLNVPALIAEVNNVSPAIAATPTISYIGLAGYPSNGLSFHCSDFSSSAGLSFAAVSWRIARVEPQGILAKGRPLYYEIKSHWQTTVNTYDTTITIPHDGLVDGGTYRVRCRMKDSAGRWSHWSAPHEFVVCVPAQAPAVEYLRVTELSYNPADPDSDELAAGFADSKLFEFIELKNISGTETIDLTGVKLAGGISFDFADSDYNQLLPGRSILVVADEAAFNARYQPSESECFIVAGTFDGSLSNGGETIIVSNDNTDFISFTYDDSWYPQTDGSGYSLEPVISALPGEIYGSLNNSANWQPSSEIGGNPQSEICN
ncbi:MAG: CotH kinase family protein, partial [Sedimentisphaerales bacterium]|nr:CotH kinase family protein [Sedimentisphaerales bacterium]